MAVAKLGVVYTPRAVAAQIVERTLAPLVAGKSGDAILALRVCDFAVGEGAFLVEVVRFLAAAHGGRDAARIVEAIVEAPGAFPDHDAVPCIVYGAPGADHARAERDGDPWHADDQADAQILARWAQLPTLGESLGPGAGPSRGVVTGCN